MLLLKTTRQKHLPFSNNTKVFPITLSFSFFLILSFLTADFEAKYGMCFGLELQDYTKYTQAIHTVHQDPTQAQLLSAANEGRVDEVVGLLEGVELSELDEVVSRE